MNTLEDLICSLPLIKEHHGRLTQVYRVYETVARQQIERMFQSGDTDKKIFAPFGEIQFPYFKMGAVDSLDLFGLDELIIFSFYWINRSRYHKVLDIGANIGLHSILLAKMGCQVHSFEPDPIHYEKLLEIIKMNEVISICPNRAAVSDHSGSVDFVRVLGNTTSSHIAGCKKPYGEVETIRVPVVNIREIFSSYQLVKMDVEGNEATIIKATEASDWQQTDAMIEIGSEQSAEQIFDHLSKIGVNAFAQKIGWKAVSTFHDLPHSYKEGSLFVSSKDIMPWT